MNDDITAIDGIRVGHWSDVEGGTGCTVILCPLNTTAGVDVRGTAPGTREIALLDPVCAVQHVNAVVLSGGSAYGLASADGVMRWLEEQDVGFDVGVAKVPIVPAAILFDLAFGSAQARPKADAGYAACVNATAGPIEQGNVGAGTGATVGKALGFTQAMKAGVGSAARHLPGDIVVGALVVVNAFGHVIDPKTQAIIAGPRDPVTDRPVDSIDALCALQEQSIRALARQGGNTTLVVVATNAILTKSDASKVAQMAHDGLARTIRPIHTHFDGDTVFALATNQHGADASIIGAIAADVVAIAVLRGVQMSESLHGIPATTGNN